MWYTNFSLPTFSKASVGHPTPVKMQGITGYTPSLKRAHATDVASFTFAGGKVDSATEKERVKIKATWIDEHELITALKKTVGEGNYEMFLDNDIYRITIPQGNKEALRNMLGRKRK
jgi:hypothetical protein